LSRIKARIMNRDAINRALVRISHEILERNRGTDGLALVGIRTGGVHLARRIAANIGKIEGVDVPLGALDVTMYRDDFASRARRRPPGKTDIGFSVKDLKVILVDDVLFTGRTIRAALDGIMDLGRPRQIQLAVLVDRGHKELPITADYVGKGLPTSTREKVEVALAEEGGADEVLILDEEAGG